MDAALITDFLGALFSPGDIVALTSIDEPPRSKYATTAEDCLAFITRENDARRAGPLCLCPNPIAPGRKRSIEGVANLNCLYVDIDGQKEPDWSTLPAKPHFVFSRGEGRFHAYWLLDRLPNDRENRSNFKRAAERLIAACNADPACKDVSRLLRIPSTRNEGGGAAYTMHARNDGPRHSLALLAGEPETPAKPGARAKRRSVSDSEIESFILQSRPVGLRAGEGRSRALWFFGLDCHAWGIDLERALQLGVKYNRSQRPPESQKVVRHQIKSAYRYSRDDFGRLRAEVEASKTDDAAARVFAVFRVEQKIRRELGQYIYVLEADRLVNVGNGIELTSIGQIEAFLASLGGLKGGFKAALSRGFLRVVDRMDFRPDVGGVFYRERKARCYNRFSGLAVDSVPAAPIDSRVVDLFCSHLEFLTNSETEYLHLLNYFAHLVQRPGIKLAHAVLLISHYEGVGKSLLETLFRGMLQSRRGEQYVSSVENSQVQSDYTDYMTDRLLVFVHELAAGDRWQTMNRLKSLITEERIPINAKYARTYYARNCANFVFFSNFADAIKVKTQTRRLFVVYHNKAPQSPEYYAELADAFRNSWLSIYRYLMAVDLSNFNAFERPPQTEGLRQLVDFSESELFIHLNKMREESEGPFASEIFSLDDVTRAVAISAPDSVRRGASYKQIKAYLAENGYTNKTVDLVIDGRRAKKSIYYARDAEPSRQTIRDFVAASANT